jgi:hypothetical protein
MALDPVTVVQTTIHLSARLADTTLCGKLAPGYDVHGPNGYHRHSAVPVASLGCARQYYASRKVTWCDACAILAVGYDHG